MHTTQLVHTQLTRTYSSTHNLLHTNPSPSLFFFLLSPCYLYLSFAACWKKLTCGVIRSFNFFWFHTIAYPVPWNFHRIVYPKCVWGGEGGAPYTGQYPTLHARFFPMTPEKCIISLGGLGVVSCLFSMSSLHYDDDDPSRSGQTMAFDRVYIYIHTYIIYLVVFFLNKV